jgi:hypothetical protein
MVPKFIIALAVFATPVAVLAAGAAAVPESSMAPLFVLGVLGVVVGRRASMRRPGEDREQD